ncbi:RNA polymerase sigma factor [Bacillus phage PK2]|nr:RNA polymerase sigma factor [Bacillus phage PK2]
MKTFNQVEDQMLNEMAIEFVNGNEIAGEKFVEIVEPKLRNYARKQYSELEKEDLTQEFMVEAIKACYEYAERYQDTGKNILGLIYTKCKQRLIDLGRNDGAEKRSRKMTVGDDVINREVSLQTPIGEDGDATMADKVAYDQKSVEDMVVDRLNEKTLKVVVKDFVGSTKGRNKEIVPLIYKANKNDWSTEKLNTAIAKVLKAETGKEPNNEAIRQAKSRAVKALRNAILDGKVTVSNQLEWEF